MKILLATFLILHGSLALAAKPCEHLLPGVERMSRGVDITSLDLFPSDLSLASGYRQSLFEFSCDSAKKYTHPSIGNFQFPIPDQISAVNTVPGGALNNKNTFHRDLKTYKKSLSVQVGLDVTTLVYGDYSLSVGFKKVQEEILSSNQSVADISAYISAVQMDFNPSASLKPNENFAKFLAKMPATYEAGADKYQEFLDTFGTHYFESGMFGGYLLQKTIIDDDFRYQTNDKDITANIQAKYQTMVNVKIPIEHSDHRKSESFNSKTTTSHYYYGGKTNLVNKFDAEQFAQWAESVPRDPWLFGGRLKPIDHLIENEAIKAQVKRAVNVKLAKAYLQELSQTLILIARQVRSTHSESTRISELLAQAVPAEADVKAIGEKVQVLIAEAQAAKDRTYLRRYSEQLNQLQHYELYCKKEVANRCDHEKKRDVNDVVAEASHLAAQMTNLVNTAGNPDTELVRSYVARASDLIHHEQTTPITECREKLFCNLCKDVVIDLIKKEPCNTAHIKKLLRVHL